MSIATRFVSSTARPRLDLKGCVLYSPLWRPDLGGSTFTTIGDGGIPTHLCTVTGATHGIQGRTFAGAGRITTPSAASLNPTNLTVWVWVYNNNSSSGAIVEKWAAVGATYPYTIKLNGTNQPLFACYDGTNEPSALWLSSISGGWHFVVGYRNLVTDKVGISVDLGTPVEATDTTVGDISNTDVLSIGARGNGGIAVTGTVGEVGIESRVLLVQEYTQIYLATKWRYL